MRKPTSYWFYSMSKNKACKETKVNKFLKSPIKVLMKFRDWYVKSMSECSDQIMYGSVIVIPTGHINTLPRSYTVGSTTHCDEDLRELTRVASNRRSLGNKIQLDLNNKHHQMDRSQSSKCGNVGRSMSVGLRKIDEHKVYDFAEDDEKFPRSRSCVVSSRRSTQYAFSEVKH